MTEPRQSPSAATGAAARARLLAPLITVAFAAGCVDLGVPDWSPDARRVVYTRLAGDRPEVRLLDVDSGERPRLIASDAFRARWSPDGERVFFLAGGEEGRKGLCSCLPDGSDVRDHVPRDTASVTWYAPTPDGGAVYYLNETDGGVLRLDLGAARAERVLPEGARCAAAALGPSAKLLACAVPAAAKEEGTHAFDVRVFDLDGGSWLGQSASVNFREGEAGLGAAPVVLFTPEARAVVAFVDPGDAVVVMPVPRGRVRKLKAARPGGVVFSSISPDGKELHLTVLAGEGRFTSQKLVLTTGKSEILVEDSPVIVGGRSWEPTGAAVAEHTPMGLKVSTPGERWKRHYPVGPDEHVRLGEDLIAAGDPATAAALAKRALEEPGADADVQRLRLLESDACAGIGDRREAARALLEAWLLSPVSEVPPGEVARRAAALRGEDRLLDVVHRSLRGDAAARAGLLTAALPLAADPALIAGLNFRIGEARLEAGDAQEAGKRFRLASETADFPAADYAAGLAGVAHYVSGRNDRYAAELLMKAVDLFPASPLQDDFQEALRVVLDPSTAILRRTPDANHPSGLAAWGSIRTVRSASWSLRPVLAAGRRILVEVSYDSSVYVAKPEERARAVISGIRADLDAFAFAPSGRLLAFVASAGGGSAAFVIDLEGTVVAGDADALATGAVGGESVISLAWDEEVGALVMEVALPDGTVEERRLAVPVPKEPAPRGRAPK